MKKIFFLLMVCLFLAACTQQKVIGGDKDAHGCLIAAGYSWCDAKQKCIRVFEEPCAQDDLCNGMTYTEAWQIAKNSSCMNEGTLKETHMCNEGTDTWWIDMDVANKSLCSPACVILIANKTAEINWRCTGAIPPE